MMRRWVFLSVAFIASQALATTYFVKPTGNDSYSGRDTLSAWQHVVRGCTTVVAGDTLFIMAGRYTGDGQNVGIRVTHSGTPADPIVIKGYGGIPVLDGQFNMNGPHWWGSIIECAEQSYIVFDSIDARNSGDPFNPSGEAGCFYAIESHHITWKDCKACSSTSDNPGGTNLAGGFMIKDSQNCVVKRCQSWRHRCAHWDSGNAAGVNIFGGFAPPFAIHNTVDSCTIWDCGAGIQVKSSECDDALVQRCRVHDCSYGVIAQADFVTIRFNVMYDNDVHGICVVPGYGTIYHDSVYNNTIVNSGNFDLMCDNDSYNVTDSLAVFSNICCSHNGGGYWRENYAARLCGADFNSLLSDYNCFYDSLLPANVVVHYQGMSLEQWTGNSGADSHSILADPLFVDELVHDYRLSLESPCRGSGRDWSDMGAYLAEESPVERRDIDRILTRHKKGQLTEEQVETYIKRYMSGE